MSIQRPLRILKLFPTEKVILHSLSPMEDVLSILHENTVKRSLNPFSKSHGKIFSGTVDGHKFRVRLANETYDHTFRPDVVGSITQSGEGSTVEAKLMLSKGTVILMSIWYAVSAGFGIPLAIGLLTADHELSIKPAGFILPSLLLISIALMYGGFRLSSGNTKRAVEALLAKGDQKPNKALVGTGASAVVSAGTGG